MVAGGCAVLETGSSFDDTTLFQSYNTYSWYGPSAPIGVDAGAAADTYSSELDFHIKRAVESGLVKNSLQPATSTPDIYVAYDIVLPTTAAVSDAALTPGFQYGYSYWYGYRYKYGLSRFSTLKDVRTLSPGTIIVDIVDATTNQLVWRGWADAALDLKSSNAKRINRIVASIMAQYPPLIGSAY
jgi:hypothetical protein